MEKYDVIVIGGGLSGLSAGALLANAGRKVLILEKGNDPGGRMATTEYKGHMLENGPHGLVRTGYMEEIFSRLGKTLPEILAVKNKVNVFYEGRWQDFGELYPRAEVRRILKEEILPLSYDELEKYDDIGLEEWVSKKANNKMTHIFFWYMGWLVSIGSEYGTISAGDALIFIKEVLEKQGGLRNIAGGVRGGCGTIIKSLADAFTERRGEIRTNFRVTNVVFKEGKVRGVEVETGEKALYSQVIDTEFIQAPVVINTLPIWELFNIVREDIFPEWYVDWVKDISQRYVNIYTIYYGMNEVPMGDEFTNWWVPKLPSFGIGGGLSWQAGHGKSVGQYQAAFWLQANWFDGLPGLNLFKIHQPETRNGMRQVFNLFEKDIKELFPGFENNYLWKIHEGATYSIAEVPGAVRKHRPSIQPPGVENFFLAGDTLQETRPTGMQAASRCVLQCVDKILGNK